MDQGGMGMPMLYLAVSMSMLYLAVTLLRTQNN